MYLYDAYLEQLEERHEARLITQERTFKPLKRDYRKYQNLRIKKTYRCTR